MMKKGSLASQQLQRRLQQIVSSNIDVSQSFSNKFNSKREGSVKQSPIATQKLHKNNASLNNSNFKGKDQILTSNMGSPYMMATATNM